MMRKPFLINFSPLLSPAIPLLIESSVKPSLACLYLPLCGCVSFHSRTNTTLSPFQVAFLPSGRYFSCAHLQIVQILILLYVVSPCMRSFHSHIQCLFKHATTFLSLQLFLGFDDVSVKIRNYLLVCSGCCFLAKSSPEKVPNPNHIPICCFPPPVVTSCCTLTQE